MEVGDLVRDKDFVRSGLVINDKLGVIIDIDKTEGMYKVVWNGYGKEWLTAMYLEVVN